MTDTTGPTAQVLDLFGRHDPLLGRALCMDLACPCGSNVTIICAGTGPHAAALRCRNCNRHRQWLSHEDYRICGTVLAEITGRFGEPVEISYRDIKQKRTEAMATEQYDNTNRGALFKNADKTDDKHADYRGELNVNGDEFWLNAWLKTSKKGAKYLSLSLKPKQPAAAAKSQSAFGDDINAE
jgi:hypothetical protein